MQQPCQRRRIYAWRACRQRRRRAPLDDTAKIVNMPKTNVFKTYSSAVRAKRRRVTVPCRTHFQVRVRTLRFVVGLILRRRHSPKKTHISCKTMIDCLLHNLSSHETSSSKTRCDIRHLLYTHHHPSVKFTGRRVQLALNTNTAQLQGYARQHALLHGNLWRTIRFRLRHTSGTHMTGRPYTQRHLNRPTNSPNTCSIGAKRIFIYHLVFD